MELILRDEKYFEQYREYFVNDFFVNILSQKVAKQVMLATFLKIEL